MRNRVSVLTLLCFLLSVDVGLAQTDQNKLGLIFKNIYGPNGLLVDSEAVLAPGDREHFPHFNNAFQTSFSAFNTALASQLTAVPLPSPASGFTYQFDAATGGFTRTTQSFGPILADRAETIGRRLKAEIRRETALVASVGIAPNKFLAKIASDLGKPDGFVVVPHGGEMAFLRDLPRLRCESFAEQRQIVAAPFGCRRKLRFLDLDIIHVDRARSSVPPRMRGDPHRPETRTVRAFGLNRYRGATPQLAVSPLVEVRRVDHELAIRLGEPHRPRRLREWWAACLVFGAQCAGPGEACHCEEQQRQHGKRELAHGQSSGGELRTRLAVTRRIRTKLPRDLSGDRESFDCGSVPRF